MDDTIRKIEQKRLENIIKEQELVKNFDEELFRAVIERITVLSIAELEFKFKSELKVRKIL